jgi:hypothetical protein
MGAEGRLGQERELSTIVNRDGSVVVRDERSGSETRVTGRAAVMLRWHARHVTELDSWACPRCGALIGSLHWQPRSDSPSHYLCPRGHVSLASAHHAPGGELLN